MTVTIPYTPPGIELDFSAYHLPLSQQADDFQLLVVRNWLDDIIIPTRTFEKQLKLLRETFHCVQQGKLSLNLPKSELCFSVVEWLGMIIDRFGIRPAPSKIEAITQLSQPSTVEEVRVLLGMAGYVSSSRTIAQF